MTIITLGPMSRDRQEEDAMGNLGPVEAVVHHDGPDTDDSEEEIDAENEAYERALAKISTRTLGADFRHRIKLGG